MSYSAGMPRERHESGTVGEGKWSCSTALCRTTQLHAWLLCSPHAWKTGAPPPRLGEQKQKKRSPTSATLPHSLCHPPPPYPTRDDTTRTFSGKASHRTRIKASPADLAVEKAGRPPPTPPAAEAAQSSASPSSKSAITNSLGLSRQREQLSSGSWRYLTPATTAGEEQGQETRASGGDREEDVCFSAPR